MSIGAFNWARQQEVGGATRKLLLLMLADRCNEEAEWSTFVGQQTLARETELSERSVIRLMAQLEDIGVIRRERRHRKDGSRTSDLTFLVPDWPGLETENPADLTVTVSGDDLSGDTVPGDKQRGTYLTSATDLPDTVAGQEPSVDPSDEPSGKREGAAAVEVVTDAVVVDHPSSPAALAEYFRESLWRRGYRTRSVPKSWTSTIEQMLQDDERTPDEIRGLIDYIEGGATEPACWWADKVKDPAGLRRNFASVVEQHRAWAAKQSRGSLATQRAWETTQAIRSLFGSELNATCNPLDALVGFPPASDTW